MNQKPFPLRLQKTCCVIIMLTYPIQVTQGISVYLLVQVVQIQNKQSLD